MDKNFQVISSSHSRPIKIELRSNTID